MATLKSQPDTNFLHIPHSTMNCGASSAGNTSLSLDERSYENDEYPQYHRSRRGSAGSDALDSIWTPYKTLPHATKQELEEVLCDIDSKKILHHSVLQIYATDNNYIEVGAILTGQYLYTIDADSYQIWSQLTNEGRQNFNIKQNILHKKIEFGINGDIRILGEYDKEYAMILLPGKFSDCHIPLKCKTNNELQAWATHLDYALNHEFSISDRLSRLSIEKKEEAPKLMNNITDQNKNQNTTNYDFGEYLNYWQGDKKNSVIAKYSTLREELLSNQYAPMNEIQYYGIYEQCLKKYKDYKKIHGPLTADHIGVDNKKFNVTKGTEITINHLISLKLYTDATNIQKKLKRNCRRRHDESLKDFIDRNSEIANWCRYLKESCTFYGTQMKGKASGGYVYCGLDAKLMFNSMQQHFECPISTTSDPSIANQFSQGSRGIILRLQRANHKTRYLDFC